jgi:UDP-N-acetyl-D-glucosamine dehydrogenase
MNTIVIHGLGYVGLTAAVHFAKAGWQVIGYDPDKDTVAGLMLGRPRAGEFLSYLDADVKALVDQGRLQATSQRLDVLDQKIHLIAVPTERNGKPFDVIVDSVLDILVLVSGVELILVESTLTPGTVDRFIERNRNRVMPHLAVCPRRDWFADPKKNLGTLPRIVGGVTPESTRKAVEVLSVVSPTIHETDYRTAELVKALENALLHVPVMLVHQLAYALPKHNVAEAVRLATTHWRFESLAPMYLGFGTGGRCVPLGTEYLVKAAEGAGYGGLTLGAEALKWDELHRHAVAGSMLPQALAGRALVLGIAYRPQFRDAGRSPGLDVAKHLAHMGVKVDVHDPMWSEQELLNMVRGYGFNIWSRQLRGQVMVYDSVLLATPHIQYRDLPGRYNWRAGQRVLDGSGMWKAYRPYFERFGVSYHQVGEPGWLGLEEKT